jgi:hypothetical protein
LLRPGHKIQSTLSHTEDCDHHKDDTCRETKKEHPREKAGGIVINPNEKPSIVEEIFVFAGMDFSERLN